MISLSYANNYFVETFKERSNDLISQGKISHDLGELVLPLVTWSTNEFPFADGDEDKMLGIIFLPEGGSRGHLSHVLDEEDLRFDLDEFDLAHRGPYMRGTLLYDKTEAAGLKVVYHDLVMAEFPKVIQKIETDYGVKLSRSY